MNIYDIARLSGVSIATVSRVVNNSVKVSEKTKEIVRRVMEENDYIPNVFARGINLDSMRTIGIICPNISDVFVASAVSYFEMNLRKYGYDCILGCSGYSQEGKELSVKRLLAKRIDALILISSTYVPLNEKDSEYIRNAAERVPVFLMNGYMTGKNIYCVYCDDEGAIYNLTKKYIQNGRKNILFLSDSHSFSASQKLLGFKKAMSDSKQHLDKRNIVYVKNSIHFVSDKLIDMHLDKIDGIIATEDGIAIGALKLAKQLEIKVPEEIFICGYNNSQLSVASEPELTSIDNRLELMCNNITERIFSVVNGKTSMEMKKVSCKLKERGTTNFA